jgi:death-on-curing family protein
MQFEDSAVQREYEYWCRQVPEDPYAGQDSVGIYDVLRAHYLLADYFSGIGEGLGGAGPRDLNLLHSALHRQFVGFGGKSKWSGLFELTATTFFGLIKNHPFHDANKRTALLTVLAHLYRRSKQPTIGDRDLEELTVRVAEGELRKYSQFERFGNEDEPEIAFLAWFLRRNSREVDNRYYIITFRELDRILNTFGGRLANPYGNAIDVMMNVTETYGFFANKTRTVEKRVAHIGFPGWSREVSRKDIDEIRRATKLTNADGVDSTAFFRGADPVSGLIATYSGMLRRLADK